jgi:hypothetical protein
MVHKNGFLALGVATLVGAAVTITETKAEESTSGVTWGAFLDTYYAFDFNQPAAGLNRTFTTQPARHNELNINLAYIEAKVERDRVHGRVAFQVGTSVELNYAAEVQNDGSPSMLRHLQEAYVGYQLGEKTWIDAGIMFSHIGLESFISKDNLSYTRSLVADYSPYYQTGIRLTHDFTDRLKGQLLLLNGWQNILEKNAGKAAGSSLSYSLSPEITVVYNTFFGKELGFRQFHDLLIKYNPSESWSLGLQGDYGHETQTVAGASGAWYGFALVGKYQWTRPVALTSRIERYSDPQAIMTGVDFRTWGASLGVDITLYQNIWWRTEVRKFSSAKPVYISDSGFKTRDTFFVTSLSTAF